MCPSHRQGSSSQTPQRPQWATLISALSLFWVSSSSSCFSPERCWSCLWFPYCLSLNTLLWSQIPLLSISSALLSIHREAHIGSKGGPRFPVGAAFLHTTNVLRGQINRNASWSGTHRRTGDAPSRRHQHYFHLLRQGRWLLCWCIVQCTTVELKDWIKWPDPTLPGGSTLQRKEIIASQLSSFRGPHCDIAPCGNRSRTHSRNAKRSVHREIPVMVAERYRNL